MTREETDSCEERFEDEDDNEEAFEEGEEEENDGSMMKNPAIRCLILLVLLFPLVQYTYGESDIDLSKYMYLKEDPKDVYPIMEYKAKPKEGNAKDRPDFLYDPHYPHPRIVEFYAHWCPHCQHFKPKYIKFARALEKLTSSLITPMTIETRAISCVPNKAICHDMDVKGYPTIMFYKANSINGTVLKHWELHPYQLLRLAGATIDEGMEDVDMRNEVPDDNNKNNNLLRKKMASPPKEPHFMERSKREVYQDAHLSLDFALRTGVFTESGALSKKKEGTLKRFLTLLQQCLPPGSSMQPLVADLLANLLIIVKGETELVKILDRHDKPAQEWSPACLQHGTGYTCGLWQLFHIITIGLVEWNKASFDSEGQLHTMSSSETIRDFVFNFFLCDECRSHFVSEFDACMYDRCNRLVDRDGATLAHWVQFPLWLFEQHNGVNVRLRKERIDRGEKEDASEFDVKWPPTHKCPSCWLSPEQWDEEKVYGYMRLEYWPEDSESQAFRQVILNETAKMKHAHQHYVPHQHPFSNAALEEERASERILPAPDGLLALSLLLFAAAVGLNWSRKKKIPGKRA